MTGVIERRTKKMDEMIQETYEENLSCFHAGNRSELTERIRELEQEAEALNRESIFRKRNGTRRQSYAVRSTAFVLRAIEATLDGNGRQKQEDLDRALILYKAAELPDDAGEYEMES